MCVINIPIIVAASFNIPLWLNFGGRFWSGAIAFAATPMYLHFLGPERFGLASFCLLVMAVFGCVSGGLAEVANREMARSAAQGADGMGATAVAVVRLAWLTGAGLAVAVLLLSGALARHWLTLGSVELDTATVAVRLTAVLVALQVPLDVFVGLFQGSRYPAAANLVLAGTVTVRTLAALLSLRFYAPTVEVFLGSQIVASFGAAVVCQWAVRRMVAVVPGWRRTWRVLADGRGFSLGRVGVAVTTMLLGQADRIALSRFLPLEDFGLYSIAVMLVNLLYFLIGPVQATYFPEFARHTAPEQRERLAQLYHQACQNMALLVAPVAAIMIFFGRDILVIWTNRPDQAAQAAPVVALLAATRLIGGINTLPYALQFAHGWTSLVLAANSVSLVVFLPVMWLFAARWGAAGAAAGYFLLCLPFLVWIVWRTHRRLLPGELARWIWHDTGVPLALALLVAGAFWLAEPEFPTRLLRVLWLGLASAITLVVVVLQNTNTRNKLLTHARTLLGCIAR